MKLTTAYQQFITFKHGQGRADRTIEDYHRCIQDHFLPWLHDHEIHDLMEITRQHLWQYAAELWETGWMQNTVGIYLSNVRTWLNWLHRQGFIETQLGAAITVPKRKSREEQPPAQEDISRLLKACRGPLGNRDRALIQMLASTGARRGEIPHLTRDDLHLEEKWLRIYQSKTDRYRFGFLTDQAQDALRIYLDSRSDDDPALFRSRFGGPLGYDGIYQMLRRRAEDAGLDPKLMHTHNFRRWIATVWIENGGDTHRLMNTMDWTSQEMLDYYVRLGSRKALQEAHAQFIPGID